MADIDANLPDRDAADGATGSAVPALSNQVAGSDGTNLRTLSTDTTGKLNIANISGTISLPSGSATAANQATEITSLGSIANTSNTTAINTASIMGQLPTALTSTGGLKVDERIDLAPASPATTTVGVASASAVAANANRKGLVIINLSINKVSFGLSGATAVLNSGITLYPGGVWYMDQFSFDTGAISAIASAASSVISIQEFS